MPELQLQIRLTGHDNKHFQNSSPRTQPRQQLSEGRSIDGTLTQNRLIASAMQLSLRTEKKEAETEIDTSKVKAEKKIKVLNGAYMEAEIKGNWSVMSGRMGNKNVKVL